MNQVAPYVGSQQTQLSVYRAPAPARLVEKQTGRGVTARGKTRRQGYITIPASSQKSCRRCQISFIFPEEMAARSSFCQRVCSSAGGSQRNINTRPLSEKVVG